MKHFKDTLERPGLINNTFQLQGSAGHEPTTSKSVFLLGVAAVAIGVLPGPVPLVPAHLLDPVLGSARVQHQAS